MLCLHHKLGFWWHHAGWPAPLSSQYGGTRTVREAYTYDVVDQIGEGTYGQVFIGFDRITKQKVR